jgi:hypothetical protein
VLPTQEGVVVQHALSKVLLLRALHLDVDKEQFPPRLVRLDLGHAVGHAPIPGREDVEQLGAARLDGVEAQQAGRLGVKRLQELHELPGGAQRPLVEGIVSDPFHRHGIVLPHVHSGFRSWSGSRGRPLAEVDRRDNPVDAVYWLHIASTQTKRVAVEEARRQDESIVVPAGVYGKRTGGAIAAPGRSSAPLVSRAAHPGGPEQRLHCRTACTGGTRCRPRARA